MPPASSQPAGSAAAGIPPRSAAVFDAAAGALVIYPGTRASVWGVNGRYLGPTIRVWNGDDVKLITATA
jgi:FtsP/CotA-like multicopper oxidase with cupredoxin domain